MTLFLALFLFSGPPVEYQVSFENAIHHEAQVEANFREVPEGPAHVKISRSSPGRYALHGFAKNIYGIRAFDSAGRQLEIQRSDSNQWTVIGHDGAIRFTYTLFADRADGTFSAVDTTHYHLNMPATFVWAEGLEDRPIRVRFAKPGHWKVATQLEEQADGAFTAPNLPYFFDSPTEISDHELHVWDAGEGENRQKIRLALHHAGSPEEGKAFAEMARAVVEEEIAVFGRLPNFNQGQYTFIACYLPYVNGDGMEHRNSTILTSTRSLERNARGNLGTVAHEFFHAWNVERIRPRTLEPFNFETPNVSGELWFAEGFTSYFDDLVLRRAGLISVDELGNRYQGLLNQVMLSPATALRGPADMSRQALFHDAASWIDLSNFRNTFISYYTYGAAMGLALDLTLRDRFKGHDLDGFMRAVWQDYGAPERPYDLGDLEKTLAAYTGDEGFARDFFARHILRGELPPFEQLLSAAGFALEKSEPEKAWMGNFNLAKQQDRVILNSGTTKGQPAYQAGLDRGDQILMLAGREIQEPGDVSEVLERARPGDTLEVRFNRRGEEISSQVHLTSDPSLQIVAKELTGRLSPEEKNFREQWLSAKSKYQITTRLHCPSCRRDFPHEYEVCPYDSERLRITPNPARGDN